MFKFMSDATKEAIVYNTAMTAITMVFACGIVYFVAKLVDKMDL